MKKTFFRIAVLSSLVGLLWGCAPKAVILTPGAVPMPEGQPQTEGQAAWSLWLSEARDVRPEAQSGQKVGTLYTRFEKNPQAAYLEPAPAEYVREQLARYLLHRGLEASSAQNARILLGVDLEQCSVLENPGSLWDELTVRVGYTVRLMEPGGRELGRVRLKGEAQRNSPLNGKEQSEAALRDALADTFGALWRSDVFQRAIRGEL